MKSTIVPIRIPNDKIESLKQEANKEFLPLATYVRRTILNTISKKDPAGNPGKTSTGSASTTA